MREFKKRRTYRAEVLNFSLRFAGAFLLLLVTAGFVRGAWDMYARLAIASEGRQEAAAELGNLEKQEKNVSSQVKELSSKRGEETLLRENYGVVKPGEGVIQIVNQGGASTTSKEPPQGWFGSLWRSLFSW